VQDVSWCAFLVVTGKGAKRPVRTLALRCRLHPGNLTVILKLNKIMKTHLWILIVLAFPGACVPLIAQTQTVRPPDQILVKEYVSPDHRFKIRFPDAPQEIDFPFETKTGQIVSHTVMHTSIVTYWMSYTDFPINFDKADSSKAWLDKGRDGSLARVAKEAPQILTETDISIDGYPGRFLRVELKGDAIIRYKIVLAGNRQYVISVGTPKGDPKDVEAQKKYEALATSFFDSFKIIPPLEADLTATWKEFSSAEGKYRIQFPGSPFRWSLPLETLRTPSTLYATVYNSSGQYTVMYLDYAEAPTPTDHAAMKSFFDDLRDGQMDMQEQTGGKLTVRSEADITFAGYPGRFMVAELNDVAVFRVKTIVVKNRVYVVTVLTPRDDPKASDPKVYERLALKFINSFNLVKEEVKQPED
jgi:hypothetical protein